MRFFQNADYKFIERRRPAYMVSAAVIAAGLLAIVVFGITGQGWVNYGVDFTGGTLVQVEFEQPTTVGEVRSAVGDIPGEEVTRFGGEN
ncbi:MAG: hypothetical protein ACOC3J_04095 [Gemmatimonadota bacterium]